MANDKCRPPYVDFYLERKPTKVKWCCPRCENENVDDYDTFDPEEIWYGNPQVECGVCGFEARLGEIDYD